MKILHIIPSLQKGGAERITLDISNELQTREDIKVKLIAFHKENTYSFLTENLDYEVIPSSFVPSIKGKHQINIEKLQKAIDHYQPDIIHLHLFESVMVASAINYQNAKWVIHFHSNMKQFAKWKWSNLFNKKALTDFYERSIVLKQFKNRKVFCISISKDTLAFINRNLSKRFSTTLLYNAIDIKRFISTNSERIPGRIVNIGSLVEKKDQELALRTIYVLRNRGHQVQLDLLGEGPMRFQLEALIRELELADSVKLHGNVDFPEKYLNQASIYLHTAIYEPFGLVLVEAMAAGIPLVCMDGKGNRDLIIEGKNGFMINERDPEKFADKIEMLLNNEELRIKMGSFARKFSEQFDIRNYVNQLLKIYNNV